MRSSRTPATAVQGKLWILPGLLNQNKGLGPDAAASNERHPWGRHLQPGLQAPAAPSHSGHPEARSTGTAPQPPAAHRALQSGRSGSVWAADHGGTPAVRAPALRGYRGRESSDPPPAAREPPPSHTAARGAGEEEARGLPRTHLGGACARRGGRCHSHSAADSSSAPPSCSESGRLSPSRPPSAATARPAQAPPPRQAAPGRARAKATEPERLEVCLALHLPSAECRCLHFLLWPSGV